MIGSLLENLFSSFPFVVISGPCVIESREHAVESAIALNQIFIDLQVPFIFKSSFDKANRSSSSSFRGPGLEKGLSILQEVKERIGVPILTDIHLPEQAAPVAEICDILQIPAFLCRQTDLLFAAADTHKPVCVKKGQFMAPWEMKNVVEKLRSRGNHKIILMDRGTSFGYQNLVSDMRSIPIMQRFNTPVFFDASHSVQLPGGKGDTSGGQREFIPTLARAAVAAGAQGVFIESHPNPEKAKSDAATVFPFKELPALVKQLKEIHSLVQSFDLQKV